MRCGARTCLQAFLGRLTARCIVEGYVTGNFSAAQAAELAGVVDDLLKVRQTLAADG